MPHQQMRKLTTPQGVLRPHPGPVLPLCPKAHTFLISFHSLH